MAKYSLLRNRIDAVSQDFGIELQSASAANDEQLLLVHTQDYLQKVVTGNLSPLEIRRLGFPWSEKMVIRSRHSTGASIDAGRMALVDRVSGNLAGGTHHSFANSGQGYCVFNDVCVAIRVLQSEGLIKNALVVDCDVHQGNGTASIANNDDSIFAFSMHCDKNYPFQKTDGDFDVALPPGTGDKEYLNSLANSLDEICVNFSPDLIFYLAGADPYIDDRLGHLSLTKMGLKRRDELVFEFATSAQIPISFCMAGGYAANVKDIVDIHFSTVEVALAHHLNRETLGQTPGNLDS